MKSQRSEVRHSIHPCRLARHRRKPPLLLLSSVSQSGIAVMAVNVLSWLWGV